MKDQQPKIAVILPCFKVKFHILDVLNKIGAEVSNIIVVDDACPEKTGLYVEENFKDSRLKIIFHQKNQGVGAAVLSGFEYALEQGAEILVKVDGDGQINPELIPKIVAPILNGRADYCKGNRFHSLSDSIDMPLIRKIGNLALSFISKFASGYMDIFDPTNGFIAIHANIARLLPKNEISKRYFFESDLLFHLGCLRAVVIDIPMTAVYQNEISNLKISKIAFEFFFKYLKNFFKRILLNYYLRDFNYGSAQLILGLPLIISGGAFGSFQWFLHAQRNELASAGTVMLGALPIILGMQLLIGFISYDIQNQPRIPLQNLIQKPHVY